MDITAFWWFFGALAFIFFFIFLLNIYDVGPAVRQSFHPAPSPTMPHHEPETHEASQNMS